MSHWKLFFVILSNISIHTVLINTGMYYCVHVWEGGHYSVWYTLWFSVPFGYLLFVHSDVSVLIKINLSFLVLFLPPLFTFDYKKLR